MAFDAVRRAFDESDRAQAIRSHPFQRRNARRRAKPRFAARLFAAWARPKSLGLKSLGRCGES